MKRPVNWRLATFGVTFGGLHLLGLAVTTAQPHVVGGAAAAASTAATSVAVQGCVDPAGNTGQGQAGANSRGRFLPDRRSGTAAGVEVVKQNRGAGAP